MGLRESKKQATRQAISDIATRLFVERGFDAVTLAEIAEAAGVARMTVTNYFPRKEDLFFDRGEEIFGLFEAALRGRPEGQTPLAALRQLVDDMLARDHPLVQFSATIVTFWRVVEQSPTLAARRREMRDEAANALAGLLAQAVARPAGDADAALAAALLTGGLAVAYTRALAGYAAGADTGSARRLFIELVDRSFGGAGAALRDTPYVEG